MDRSLFVQAVVKYLVGIILFSVLLFIPAGTLYYWNAWLLIGVLFIPMLIVGIILAIKNPELLRKRLNAKEQESEQKSVIDCTGFAGHVEKTYNEVKGRVRNYEREQISQKV